MSGIAVLTIGLAPNFVDPQPSAALGVPFSASIVPAPAASFGGAEATHIAGIDQFPKWTDMLHRWSAQVAAVRDCVTASGGVEGCAPAEWAQLTAQLQPLDRHAMLDRLNRAINAHGYVAATENWGRRDYWETPFEFMSRNGQCEDYAIAKFMLLRALGFANDDLRVLVVRDVVRQIDHA